MMMRIRDDFRALQLSPNGGAYVLVHLRPSAWSVMEISAADLLVLAKSTATLPRLESAMTMSLETTRRQALNRFKEKLAEMQTTEYREDTGFLPGR